MEIVLPEDLRELAKQKEYRFDSAEDLLTFASFGYSDGRFWKGIGEGKETLSYRELRELAIKGLSDEFKDQGFDRETLTNWCNNAPQLAQSLYDQATSWSKPG